MRLLCVSGSHREAGRELGAATAEVVRRWAGVPFDRTLVERYRAVTAVHLPWVIEELDGVAEGAGVDPLAVFAGSVAEIGGGCTDLVVMPDASADGHLLVAHSNDYIAKCERDFVAVEWRVVGEPVCFTLGLGPWLAAGWNEAGLSVTVDNLDPADTRVGIPRVLQLRQVVRRRTLAEAAASALHPARASSYNWVLAHRDGSAANIEAGARCAETTRLMRGVFAHTNHYTHRSLFTLQDGQDRQGSRTRLCHAERRLASGNAWSAEALREVLSDHQGAPDSLCRHGRGEAARTVFWSVADVTAGRILYGSGPPCESEPISYALGKVSSEAQLDGSQRLRGT